MFPIVFLLGTFMLRIVFWILSYKCFEYCFEKIICLELFLNILLIEKFINNKFHMLVMTNKKSELEKSVNKIKKETTKTIDTASDEVKKVTNINRYNKYLFVFETVLAVGVIDEFFEGVVTGLQLNFYLHVLILMLAVGLLFTAAFRFLEPLTKGTVVWLVRFNKNKFVRVLVHALILGSLFYFYSLVFFNTQLSYQAVFG